MDSCWATLEALCAVSLRYRHTLDVPVLQIDVLAYRVNIRLAVLHNIVRVCWLALVRRHLFTMSHQVAHNDELGKSDKKTIPKTRQTYTVIDTLNKQCTNHGERQKEAHR